jgi:hypothetical protein
MSGSDPHANLPPGAKLMSVPRQMINQVAGAFSAVFGRGPRQPGDGGMPAPTQIDAPRSAQTNAELGRLGALTTRVDPWFGPGRPTPAVAPRADVAGRAFDYPVAYNTQLEPRAYEGVDFETLYSLADFDMVRLAIETRKDQMAKLTWKFQPRKKDGENTRPKADGRCDTLNAFFRSPDRRSTYEDWQRMAVEQQLSIDALSIYVRRTRGGDPYSLEILDGAGIMPRLDATGRTPLPPEAAYTQVLKGVPAVNYSADELYYFPRNRRVNHVYGCSPVQQILATINIAVRREAAKVAFWTEGNIPEALVSVPKDWTPEQIKSFQNIFDNAMNDIRRRRKMKFVPGEMVYTPLRPVQTMDPDQDEWLARVICYAFSLPPLPFVKMMNRSTSETADDAALEEGLAPNMIWLKGVIDRLVQFVWGFDDIEMVYDDHQVEPQAEKEARLIQSVRTGLRSLDEARADLGLEPLGMGPAIFGVGPLGITFISDLLQGQKTGATALPLPQPPDAGLGGAIDPNTGQPIPGAPQPPMLAGPVPPQMSQTGPGDDGSGGAISPNQAQPAPAQPSGRATPPLFDQMVGMLSPDVLDAVGLGNRKAAAAPSRKPIAQSAKKHGPSPILAELESHEKRLGRR